MAATAELRRVFRRGESVIRREIAGETFLVPVSGQLAHLQRIFVLNPVAAHVWDRLDGEGDLETVLDSILAQFEVDLEVARADLLELVGELHSAKLIRPGAGA